MRHLRGGCTPQALLAFKGELDTLFPASKYYDAPGFRLLRSRHVAEARPGALLGRRGGREWRPERRAPKAFF